MIRIALLTMLLLPAGISAAAEGNGGAPAGLRSAEKALAAGDYGKAYGLFSGLADKNPLAQFNVALFHHYGWDRPVDEVVACAWFEKAAQGKIPAAEHFFGDCLAGGIGRPADYGAALEWYQKAADHGHLISYCSAGELYVKGKGVAKDPRRGLELCAEAARQEVPLAMLRLADYYREGTDVKQDLAAARYWYQQAAERHSHEAQYRLGIMLADGLGGERDPNTALFWFETAAGEGYSPAYLPSAILYANADTDPKTGVLAPEHLAKIYLWISAAKARTTDKAQLAEINRIESMVLTVMPPAWRGDLDKQVAAHLAKHQNDTQHGIKE